MRSIWNRAKTWNSISIGPLAVLFRLARKTKVSSNSLRKGIRNARILTVFRRDEPRVEDTSASGRVPGSTRTAVIVGAGPGLGYALAETLATAGFQLALVARNAERLDPLVAALRESTGLRHHAYGCDATLERSVQSLFSLVGEEMGTPDLVVYAVQAFDPGRALDIEICAFENSWRQNCLGAFITAREAGRGMLARKKGTIILVGSTSGIIGRANHLNLAVGKFGLRAISQVLARELWPMGIHVVHCVIDADIQETVTPAADYPQSDPKDIAGFILGLHLQPRSAWTSEADLRPFNERFWEHC